MDDKLLKDIVIGEVIDICPHCKGDVIYSGKGFLLDGYIRGLGFKGHVGQCVKCHSKFQITEEEDG